MLTYYLTILAVFLLSLSAESFAGSSRLHEDGSRAKLPFGTKVCLVLCAFVLIFVAGCRYYVGSDFGAYYRGISVYGSKLKESILHFDEPGLPIIASIVGLFTDDGAYFIFVCSLLTIGLYLITMYRNEDSYLMVSILFIFTVWDGSFNGVRQYLASAILFCGHRTIHDKKIWKWILTVFLASCVHISAVVMFVLYFLLRNRVSAWHIFLLTLGTYIVSANYDRIFSLIGLLKNSEMAMTSYATRSVNVLRILVACAPAILSLVIYSNQDITDEQTFYINALVVHAAAMVAASNSAYLARIGIYTSPYVSVALPKLLRLKNQAIERIIRIGSLLLYFLFWYKDISGNPEMNTFQWVFLR